MNSQNVAKLCLFALTILNINEMCYEAGDITVTKVRLKRVSLVKVHVDTKFGKNAVNFLLEYWPGLKF